ncbi:MAG: M48 family metalloprotease [Roseovarius sp.]
MIGNLIDRWQERFADRLLEQAKREVDHPRPRVTGRLAIGWVLSFLLLATPYVTMAGGVALIIAAYPDILPIIVGLILIGFGFTLLPPGNRNRIKTYCRSDLPELFSLLDRIADKLGTSAPDGVHIDHEVNAYMAQFRSRFFRQQEWVLGIGLPLWAALTPDERIALLAHELAHRVNDDPMRHGVFARANAVLENWYDTFELDCYYYYNEGHIAQIVAAMVIGTYQRALSRFSFFESQRAEYRADAFSMRVAGAGPVIKLLETITRTDLATRSIVDLYPYVKDRNARIFDHMGRAISDADPAIATRYLAEAAREKKRVDNSHPPTAMRIEFISALPATMEENRLLTKDIDFAAIEAELQPLRNDLGKQMMEDLYEAELNR